MNDENVNPITAIKKNSTEASITKNSFTTFDCLRLEPKSNSSSKTTSTKTGNDIDAGSPFTTPEGKAHSDNDTFTISVKHKRFYSNLTPEVKQIVQKSVENAIEKAKILQDNDISTTADIKALLS